MSDAISPAGGDDLDPELTQLDCSAVLADVWLLLDNECDPGARSRISAHLDSCPTCLAHYGIESQLKALINRKCGGDHAPEGLRARLSVEIRKTVAVHESQHGAATSEVTQTRITRVVEND